MQPKDLNYHLYAVNFNNEPQVHATATQIVPLITKNTTPQAFEDLCKKVSDYKLAYCTDMYSCYTPFWLTDYYNIRNTALGEAIKCNNLLLVQHIVERLDSSALNHALGKGMSALFLAVWTRFASHFDNKNEDNAKIIRLLVSKGADINLASKFESSSDFAFYLSPLAITCQESDVDLAKFLLENGARKYFMFTPEGKSLLKAATEFKRPCSLNIVKEALQEGAITEQQFVGIGEQILAQAKEKIEAHKHLFWVGSLDRNSKLSVLSKEIIARISTLGWKPAHITEKVIRARKQIDAAISTICKTELLFWLSRSDANSIVAQMLPTEIVVKILSDRIALN